MSLYSPMHVVGAPALGTARSPVGDPAADVVAREADVDFLRRRRCHCIGGLVAFDASDAFLPQLGAERISAPCGIARAPP